MEHQRERENIELYIRHIVKDMDEAIISSVKIFFTVSRVVSSAFSTFQHRDWPIMKNADNTKALVYIYILLCILPLSLFCSITLSTEMSIRIQ